MSLPPAEEEELHEQYVSLLKFYQEPVKGVILAAERVDKQQRIPGASIIEIRSAFEHIARAHAALYGFGDDEVRESGLTHYLYCCKNLNKAHAHMFRAAYDAYDSIGIAMTASIRLNLDSISKATLFSVIPDAAEKIIAPYEAANQLITEEKKKKDVVGKEQEEKVYVQYEKAIQQLIKINKYLNSMMGTLVAYEKESKAQMGKTTNFTVIGLVLTALSLLAALIAIWPSKTQSTSPTAINEDTKSAPSKPTH